MNNLIKVFLVIFISFLSSPSYSETVSWDEMIENPSDGLVYKKFSSEPFTGFVTKKDILGFITKGSYKNGKKHGLWETYYENGLLKNKANYRDGKNDGTWEVYSYDGSLSVKGIFKDGKKDGLWKTFFQNGQVESKETYKDGKRVGFWEYYYKNGKLWKQQTYTDGTDGFEEKYNR